MDGSDRYIVVCSPHQGVRESLDGGGLWRLGAAVKRDDQFEHGVFLRRRLPRKY